MEEEEVLGRRGRRRRRVEEEEEVVEEEEEVVEEEEEEVVEEEEEEGEVIELSFIEKRLKPPNRSGRVLYLITDDEEREIYTRLENGEPGECVGKLVGKSARPKFYSKD